MRTNRKYSNRWFGSYPFQSSFVWLLYLMSESKEIQSHKLGKVNVPSHPGCHIQREEKSISGSFTVHVQVMFLNGLDDFILWFIALNKL